MGESIDELYKSYQDLLSSANAVRMLVESPIVRGSHNRKPLDFYTDESCTLLHAWKKVHREVDAVWRHVCVRDLKTIEIVKQTQQTPLKCQEMMDEYLLYCSLMPSNKRNR